MDLLIKTGFFAVPGINHILTGIKFEYHIILIMYIIDFHAVLFSEHAIITNNQIHINFPVSYDEDVLDEC
jgi:hypothetical protein